MPRKTRVITATPLEKPKRRRATERDEEYRSLRKSVMEMLEKIGVGTLPDVVDFCKDQIKRAGAAEEEARISGMIVKKLEADLLEKDETIAELRKTFDETVADRNRTIEELRIKQGSPAVVLTKKIGEIEIKFEFASFEDCKKAGEAGFIIDMGEGVPE